MYADLSKSILQGERKCMTLSVSETRSTQQRIYLWRTECI